MKIGFIALITVAALALFLPSAQAGQAPAVLTIEIAEVQNGSAFVKGNGADRGVQILWEGTVVTTSNKNNGGFSFNGVVPQDCVGELSDGNQTINVQVFDCTPGGTSTAPAPVPQTGQTTSFATGDDGDLEKGVPWPSPRFTDNGDGTITDHLTGLIWLKNANCPGDARTWQQALDFVAGINDGTNNCGDTSNAGSNQTDWRLPNVRELQSLVDYSRFNPSLPQFHPFSNFQTFFYWSSTTLATSTSSAWIVFFDFGSVFNNGKTFNGFVIAVRGGS